MEQPTRRPRKKRRGLVAILAPHALRMERGGVETRRSARLKARHGEARALELVRERVGRGLPVASARHGLVPDVDGSPEKGSCGEHHGLRGDFARGRPEGARHAPVLEAKGDDFVLQHREVRFLRHHALHPPRVGGLVALDARRLDGRAPSRVEHARLQHRKVRIAPHLAAEGVQLRHEVRLGDTPDGGIARHRRNPVAPQRREERPATQPGRRQRRLGARVSASDYQDVALDHAPTFLPPPRRAAEPGPEVRPEVLAARGVALRQAFPAED